MREFYRDFDKAQARITGEMEAKVRGAALQVFTQIIERTPVDTGRLRGNWRTGYGQVVTGTTDRTGAAPALSEAQAEAGKYKIEGVLYFANNLPYAQVIEDGNSKQAPTGMVAVSLQAFESALRKRR